MKDLPLVILTLHLPKSLSLLSGTQTRGLKLGAHVPGLAHSWDLLVVHSLKILRKECVNA